MSRVLVCGGRDFADRDLMYRVLDHCHAKKPFSCVIEGEAPGADRMARNWALSRGLAVARFPAEWTKYKNRAGPIRNSQMLKEGKPDLVIAFPGHTGTADMIDKARKAKLPVMIIDRGTC